MFQEYEQLEQQIAEHQARIEELQEQMAQAERKKDGVIAYDKALVNLAAEYHMDEEEFFVARGQQIVEWLVAQLGDEDPADYVQTLKARVARHLKKEGDSPRRGRRAAPAAKAAEPKLETGHYRNPYTGATVEKKKRNPKALSQWIDEYGLDTVKEWKI
ncbi:DNA binding protein [Microbulbifer sp. EKSA008]|uniref:DNA binding protein n=1 Tax=unclassified Microbulbifer TaxID=2619833 RepID=UPI0024AD4C23|nr:DNA binding protein [Microbulbifer sp. VAAF005]WHI45427.1 DNA binding protein [Microbulbifer sp. VAAF005]WNZ55862.1 DNA binding protein [Microbulbifer sp. MKSA007]